MSGIENGSVVVEVEFQDARIEIAVLGFLEVIMGLQSSTIPSVILIHHHRYPLIRLTADPALFLRTLSLLAFSLVFKLEPIDDHPFDVLTDPVATSVFIADRYIELLSPRFLPPRKTSSSPTD